MYGCVDKRSSLATLVVSSSGWTSSLGAAAVKELLRLGASPLARDKRDACPRDYVQVRLCPLLVVLAEMDAVRFRISLGKAVNVEADLRTGRSTGVVQQTAGSKTCCQCSTSGPPCQPIARAYGESSSCQVVEDDISRIVANTNMLPWDSASRIGEMVDATSVASNSVSFQQRRLQEQLLAAADVRPTSASLPEESALAGLPRFEPLTALRKGMIIKGIADDCMANALTRPGWQARGFSK
jgi:hypothetical protein